MEHEVTIIPSKCNDIVGTDDLLPDEKEKIEKQNWLRRQVDYTIKVKIGKNDEWQDFTGLFLMKDGWTKDKVNRHIKENFKKEHYSDYTFGLFKRYYHNTTNNINNNFKFDYLHNIKLLSEELPLD